MSLPSENIGQHFESNFGEQLLGLARRNRRTHRAFESPEESFHRPALAILHHFEIPFGHAAAPQTLSAPIGPVLGRFDYAFHSSFLPHCAWTHSVSKPEHRQLLPRDAGIVKDKEAASFHNATLIRPLFGHFGVDITHCRFGSGIHKEFFEHP
jgi:hypothetical protein